MHHAQCLGSKTSARQPRLLHQQTRLRAWGSPAPQLRSPRPIEAIVCLMPLSAADASQCGHTIGSHPATHCCDRRYSPVDGTQCSCWQSKTWVIHSGSCRLTRRSGPLKRVLPHARDVSLTYSSGRSPLSPVSPYRIPGRRGWCGSTEACPGISCSLRTQCDVVALALNKASGICERSPPPDSLSVIWQPGWAVNSVLH